jgi:hypothetical protein
MIDLLLHNLRTIGTHHCDGTVGEEAADEIERLRAEVAGLREDHDALLQFAKHVRRYGDTGIASMAIAVLAARKGEA